MICRITTQHPLVSGGFTYGEPCSERNTAFLQKIAPRYPLNHNIKCVDITSVRNVRLSQKILKAPNYKTFFAKTVEADTLYADHMNLTKFPIFVVRSLPKVETIDLSGNRLRRIPNKMFKIVKNLDKLLIADNNVAMPKRTPLFSSKSIKTLMLSNNGIEQLYKQTFTLMPVLEVLYLDSNKITNIAPIFNTVPRLKYLHLGNNFLINVPQKDLVSSSLVQYITKSQKNVKDLKKSNQKFTTPK